MAATMNLIDPFRVANYLEGIVHFEWSLASVTGGSCVASNGLNLDTLRLSDVKNRDWDFVIVSSSWAPETHCNPELLSALKTFAKYGCSLGGLDTGAFVLAEAGLLKRRSATVHYEHSNALHELHPSTTVVEDLFVFDGNRISCCGGAASIDFALQIIKGTNGNVLANQAARYLYQENLRPIGTKQQPDTMEPLGSSSPDVVKQAITVMEDHIEEVLSIPDICKQIKISQRQLDRLFADYVNKTPALYYRDIRLDRARGLVTQTEMSLTEVCVACGFVSPVHFSRVYKERFGLPPKRDRIEGRIPFEYRAKPLHKQRH